MRAKQQNLLREAAEWRLISLLFECPDADWKTKVKTLSDEITDSELKAAAELAQTQASEQLYYSIFEPGGRAPIREIAYRSRVHTGYLLSELSTFYFAFSFQPKTAEIVDHIAVETAFIAYLKFKQAFAEERGDWESSKITAKAAETFNQEHLAKMTEPIAKTLASSDIKYLALASEALFKRVGKDNDKRIRQILHVLGDADNTFFDWGDH